MSFLIRARTLPSVNAAYAVADYLAQPLLLLCTAPALVRSLGMEQYAIFVLAGAAVSGGTLLSAGFGDAAIKHISARRMVNDKGGIERIVRSLLSLNLLFGTLLATALCVSARALAGHLPHLPADQRGVCAQAFILGGLLLVVKSAESVFVCALRALELYSATTRISITIRVVSPLAAVVLAVRRHGVLAVLAAMLVIAVLGLAAQAWSARRNLGLRNVLPGWSRSAVGELFGFGCYSWLQGVVGLLIGQADRFIVGFYLGAQDLTYYSVCVQVAQPVHGIAAAGLQVLFPHFGARLTAKTLQSEKPRVLTAIAGNLLLVVCLAVPLVLAGPLFLRHWMGADFAAHAGTTLRVCVWGFALLGMNVAGYWTLMALGRVRLLAFVNLAGAAAMLAAMCVLAPRFGIVGAAIARLLYGPVTWTTYIALRNIWHTPVLQPQDSPASLRTCENS